MASVCSSVLLGSAVRSCHRALSTARTPPCRSSRSALLDVLGVLDLVGVDEDQVVRAVAEPGQHVQRRTGDQPEALGGDADGEERLARGLLVLGLDVDAGQDAVGLHAGEQGQSGDAGSGADLDHGLGLQRRARRVSALAHRGRAAVTPNSARRRPRGRRGLDSSTKSSA